ncbi:hypothetical protein HanRHA438_Chr04g0188071 [Helianthus annuus]|uniref:Uncharacterized protein n=1 Tax=Helianthus annuus TaxID=4232 RepID=A0A9K3J9C4_HELAN|nr:hypothetical protein HanXRQr2_Chr04g0178501 [Helianthus annuus]KAJ0589959.1 hypothetical protein HanIR_Chr04g0192111 [Helianthus annuus]KAJ0927897.1 hypothetical protein HanRHA438_Chr04g0188071 [Helianthus annuus]
MDFKHPPLNSPFHSQMTKTLNQISKYKSISFMVLFHRHIFSCSSLKSLHMLLKNSFTI